MATKSIIAPVMGLNVSDPLAGMKEGYAVELDNWFPDNDRVIVRPGSAVHATGLSARVETLMPYTATDGSQKLFAASNGDIFDVTVAGAVGSAEVTGRSNARYEFEAFSTSGGSFLLACNGVDTPLIYNGSTFTTMTLTLPGTPGYTIDSISWIRAHQRRLWFGIKDSTDMYYLPVDSIAGTLILFNVGAAVQKGGSIIQMGTWTRDSGAGPDDVAVFATSEGEFLVYEGIDPNSAASWGLTGVYRMGRPISERCMVKLGGDLMILTDDGVIPMIGLTAGQEKSDYASISKKVNRLITTAARTYGATFGWQPIVIPSQRSLIINSPTGASTAKQFVFNTETFAACTYSGLNALCWADIGGAAYFGRADGSVVKFGVGTSDDGTAITARGATSFIEFRQRCNLKRIEVLLFALDNPSPDIQASFDYALRAFTSSSAQIPSSIARFGVAQFGVSQFALGETLWGGWMSVSGNGRSVSVQVRTQTTVGRPAWTSTTLLYISSGSSL